MAGGTPANPAALATESKKGLYKMLTPACEPSQVPWTLMSQ
jgi:hypothetical protein